jgi:hypothetical protein
MLPEMSAALVCDPPLIDCRSTSRPLSLKMPFSNAYHGIQSSALMLLYAEMTFVQHGRVDAVADAAACVGELDVPPPVPPPPQAVRGSRESLSGARGSWSCLDAHPFPALRFVVSHHLICGRHAWNRFSMR